MAEKDTVIILSGGMDSITLLYDYSERIALAVSFDYGSNHNSREIPFAQWHCQQLGIKHIILRLDFMQKYFHSSLLEGSDAIPNDDYSEDNMRSTVVPFRNGIMLAIAAGLAESNGLARVMMANHGGDHSIYPDCRSDFVEAMNSAIMSGTYDNITLVSPYTNLSKAEIAFRGHELGIDYSKTWSCYRGGIVHCGECATCRERKKAFTDNAFDDPTEYLV